MIPTRQSRKPDPFIILLLAVALGMSVTIMYQIHAHNNTIPNIRNAQNMQAIQWNNGPFPKDFIP
ncbi:hypothetical protein TI05_05465 [Achromatium sp. WMS3]|nr:hypothetical protein TI05_05465 [Achromatium sp. WMS3]